MTDKNQLEPRRFIVVRGADQGQSFPLDDDVVRIGRDRSAAIQLSDGEVSRRHAEIRRCTDGYQVVDLDSSNGTFVNGSRVRDRVLRPGDKVRVGRTVMVFADPSGPRGESLDSVNITSRRSDESSARIVGTIEADAAVPRLDDEGDTTDQFRDKIEGDLLIMYRTALATSRVTDIDQLLSRVLELIFDWVAADRGCILLVDEEGGQPVPRATRLRDTTSADRAMEISRTLLDHVRTRREGILFTDAPRDPRLADSPSLTRIGTREAICVPMLGRFGMVGFLYIDAVATPGDFLDKKPRARFTDEHLKLIVAVAHQAALAIENTHYYQALLRNERLAAIGQAIAMLSHDVKNILQGIRGGSYMIEEGLKNSDQHFIAEGWRIVEKNQERISHLVMDMLSFSSPHKPERVLGDLNAVVADVVELASQQAKEAKVVLDWTPTNYLPKVAFDAVAMHRAVLNIVLNAIDACAYRDDACVNIRILVDAAASAAKIIVLDNGRGIAPEDLSKVFSVFETRKGSRGSGLGLSVSQKIVEEHGGTIEVHSQQGRSTQFTIILPFGTPADDDDESQAFDTTCHDRPGGGG